MPALGKDLVFAATDQISLVRPGAGTTVSEGAGTVESLKDLIVDALTWSTTADGLVKKATDAETTQDIELPLGNGVGGPAVGALDDALGVTAAGVVKVINANHRQAAKTWNLPSVRFPTIASLLTFLGTKHLTGTQTVNLAAGLFTETSAWPIHPQANMIHIVGAALTAPVVATDEVRTSFSGAGLQSDIAASKANIATKVPTEIRFSPAQLMVISGESPGYRLTNVMVDSLNVIINDCFSMPVWKNVFKLNGYFYSFQGRLSLEDCWFMSDQPYAIFAKNSIVNVTGSGVYAGEYTGMLLFSCTGSISAGAGADVVARGYVSGIDFSHSSDIALVADAANATIRLLGDPVASGSAGARFTASTQVVGSGTVECVGYTGAVVGTGASLGSNFNTKFVKFRFEANGAGVSLLVHPGGKVVLPVAAHEFVSASAASHVQLGHNAELTFLSSTSTFTGGTPTSNMNADALARVTLNGTPLPLAANIPLNTLAGNGAFIAS